jgi:rSAM/selenodomain-associated transferase 1
MIAMDAKIDKLPTLMVFLKYPEAGRVKTRLAHSIGAERAAALYRHWIGHVFDGLQAIRGQIRIVACYDGAPELAFAPWSSLADEWWPQPAGDLGHRLRDAFQRAHQGAAPVVAVGTDCLQVDAPLVRDALNVLTERDVVFGPATDGGYYLVGTARPLEGFFQDIPWSSAATMACHHSLCRDRGWSVGFLPILRDIDTWEDFLMNARKDSSEEICR